MSKCWRSHDLGCLLLPRHESPCIRSPRVARPRRFQTALDHVGIAVVAQRSDSRPTEFEVHAGEVEVSEPAGHVTQVQVQRRVEPAHRARHASLPCPDVVDHVRCFERPQVPDQFVGRVVLDVGHRVRHGAAVEGVAIRTDLAPQVTKHLPSSVSLTGLAKFDGPADPDHPLVCSLIDYQHDPAR